MEPFNRYPVTNQTKMDFHQRIHAPNPDIPSIELTEENVRNLEVIWKTINELVPRWLSIKENGFHIPNLPITPKDYWGSYATQYDKDPFDLLEAFSEGKGKTAIDLGCGWGDVTQCLLKYGYTVTAVDNSPSAIKIIKALNPAEIKSGQLKVVQASISKYTPDEPADLVVCKDVLPYVNPSKLQPLLNKIHDTFIKEDGSLLGTFFSTTPHPDQQVIMNQLKEAGAWFIPDRRMVKPLLEDSGFHIDKCVFRMYNPELPPRDQLAIHFSTHIKI